MSTSKPHWVGISRLAMVFISFILLIAACKPTSPTPGGPAAAKACNGDPNAKPCFLTRKGIGSQQESNSYYSTIDPTGAKATFSEWLRLNGFGADGSGDVRAIFYNDHDLNLGRDMNCCMSSVTNIACYVTNYGPDPANAVGWFLQPDAIKALKDAADAFNKVPGNAPFATVAMEWIPFSFEPNPFDNVKFYVFDGNGNRQTQAILDSEGIKQVPQICLPCHGGSYDTGTHTVFAASFLPFDVFHMVYSSDPKLTLAAQQENFRLLNAIVKATGPNPTNSNNPIVQLIDTWYPNGVNVQGSLPIDKEPRDGRPIRDHT